MDRKQVIKYLTLIRDSYDYEEIDEELEKAISDMEKLHKIEEIISKQDELMIEIYGACIPEGYVDLFGMIEQIVKEVE